MEEWKKPLWNKRDLVKARRKQRSFEEVGLDGTNSAKYYFFSINITHRP